MAGEIERDVEALARAMLANGFIQLAVHFPRALAEVGLSVTEALEQALRLAEEAIVLAPRLPEGHVALGRLLLCHDEPEALQDAAEVLQQALELAPGHDPAELDLAVALRERGERAAATAAVEAVIARGSALPQAYLARALLALDGGRLSDARRDVERAVKLAPEAGLFRLDAAEIAERAGDAAAAAAHREAAQALLGRAYEVVARLLRRTPG